MTNLLYLFNPDQDLALASGETNYMAPASARKMAEELALLPIWLRTGSAVCLLRLLITSLFWKRCSGFFHFLFP